jgi:phosphoribosylformylglycinamidine synthase
MNVAVVQFPGSNCELDAVRAAQRVTGTSPALVWHKDTLPPHTDFVILPGGFSYGDYLRAGAIARFSPVMKSVTAFARAGGLVLGICNGFQILLEVGLLPGAMLPNSTLRFVCKWVWLRTERRDLAFTRDVAPVIRLPIAHGQGNYFIGPDGLEQLRANRQIVFRYCAADGTVGPRDNPNGSVDNIAGIVNEAGNVLGMMPHPERAVDPDLGGTDGSLIFRSVQAALEIMRAS